nr:MFS transporter [Kineococcus aurantiacus]
MFAAVTTEVLPVGLLPQLSAAFGVGEAGIGWWVTAYALVVAVGAVPLTSALARVRRRPALVALLLAYALSNAVVVAAPGYAVAVAARLLGGLAHAGVFSVAVATAVALVPREEAGRALALVNGGIALALSLGVPLGTAVGEAVGWRWAFGATSVLLLVLAAAALRLVPATLAAHEDVPPVLPALRRPGLPGLALATVALTLGHYGVYTYVTPVVLAAGVRLDHVSLVLFGYGAAGVVGVLVAGVVADRHPLAALRASVAVLLGCVVAVVLAGSAAPTTAVVAVWGAAFGALPTLLQTVALRVTDGSDAAPAVVNASFNVGIGGGAVLGGSLLGAGPGWQAGVAGALVACGLLLTRGARPARLPQPVPGAVSPGVRPRR